MTIRQHNRIRAMAETLGVALHYDREIARFTYTAAELEAILQMAVMAGQNPFVQDQDEDDECEPPAWVNEAMEEMDNVLKFRKGRTRGSAS